MLRPKKGFSDADELTVAAQVADLDDQVVEVAPAAPAAALGAATSVSPDFEVPEPPAARTRESRIVPTVDPAVAKAEAKAAKAAAREEAKRERERARQERRDARAAGRGRGQAVEASVEEPVVDRAAARAAARREREAERQARSEERARAREAAKVDRQRVRDRSAAPADPSVPLESRAEKAAVVASLAGEDVVEHVDPVSVDQTQEMDAVVETPEVAVEAPEVEVVEEAPEVEVVEEAPEVEVVEEVPPAEPEVDAAAAREAARAERDAARAAREQEREAAKAAKVAATDTAGEGRDLTPTWFSIVLALGAFAFGCAILLAVGAFVAALGAGEGSGWNDLLTSVCDTLVGPLNGTFSFEGADAARNENLVTWGLGSTVYLAVGWLVQYFRPQLAKN